MTCPPVSHSNSCPYDTPDGSSSSPIHTHFSPINMLYLLPGPCTSHFKGRHCFKDMAEAGACHLISEYFFLHLPGSNVKIRRNDCLFQLSP